MGSTGGEAGEGMFQREGVWKKGLEKLNREETGGGEEDTTEGPGGATESKGSLEPKRSSRREGSVGDQSDV